MPVGRTRRRRLTTNPKRKVSQREREVEGERVGGGVYRLAGWQAKRVIWR